MTDNKVNVTTLKINTTARPQKSEPLNMSNSENANYTNKKIIGCIPARYASTRLPGKPLCDIAGKAMILHVVERAKQARTLSDVVVLSDDQRILETVIDAGYQAVLTSENCASGTDRIAEYMQTCSDADIFVNMQGDEVMLDPSHIDKLVTNFCQQTQPEMGTLAHWCEQPDILNATSTAKVVVSNQNNALYFSRHTIPIHQDGSLPRRAQIHIGVYIYTRETLKQLMQLEQTPLEKIEKLEQLRALESGINISVITLDEFQGLSVDTKADLEKARELLA